MALPGPLRRLLALVTGARQLQRIDAVDEHVVKFGRAQREEAAAQRLDLRELRSALSTRASADSMRQLERRVEDLQRSIAQQERRLSESLERARLLDVQAMDDRRFARTIDRILRRDRPVIVGPWTGEVGFELLYWVPFVRWVAATFGLAPDRLLVVSRGGVASWYGDVARNYADVFSFFTPDEFQTATADKTKKQRRLDGFDTEVVKRVIAARSLEHVDLLHPGMMYRLFMPYLKELATAARVDRYTLHARLEPPDDPVLRALPSDYVAARFYFSDCFPDTPANRAFVASTIESLSRQTPVVVLNTSFALDDHHDVAPGPRVVTIADHMVPERNLAVQSAVIARARAFVGTYGGYSYLAPFYGVNAVAFYSERTFKPQHLHLAQRVFDRFGGATLVPLDVAALSLVRLSTTGSLVTIA